MKKIFAFVLAVCMILALAACGAPKTAEYKLGMGISLNMNSSKENNAQVDATVAAVVLDKDGKIVACKIDVAQNKMDVTDGQVDTAKAFKTKVELKEDYGMTKASAIGLEWYQQAENFEKYVIGKTADEVAAIETRVDGSHTVAVDEALYATCSMSIADFMEAIVKACNDEQGKTFQSDGNFKLGLAANTKADESTAAAADAEGVVKMYSEFGAVVIGSDGKILAAVTDATQPQIKIDTAGQIVDTSFKGTKRELKEEYGMSKIGAVEWYIQAQNFTDYVAGKTAEELNATETVEDGAHILFKDETLRASCSISIDGMIAVLVKAAGNAA